MRSCLTIACVAVLLAACGNSPKFADVAPEAAEEAVLSSDDLPPGWQEESSGTLSRVELSGDCDVLSPAGAFPAARATASSPSFATVDRRSVQSFSAVYAAPDQASAALAGLDPTVERCHDEFQGAVRKAAEAEIEAQGLNLGPFAKIDVSIARGEAPDAGDESTLYRVQVRVGILGTVREFNADIALVREKRVIGAMLYSAYGNVDSGEELAFLEVIARRLAEADGKLP